MDNLNQSSLQGPASGGARKPAVGKRRGRLFAAGYSHSFEFAHALGIHIEAGLWSVKSAVQSWIEVDAMKAGNSRLEKLLEPDLATVERRSAERRPVDNFSAYRWNGSRLTQEPVKDISTSGLYMITAERWQPDTLLSLILQRQGPLEVNPERRIEVEAMVVRWGEDGVGLEFVLEGDAESRQWVSLRESLIEQAKPEAMLSMVRLVQALAFLSRLCPGEAEKVGQLLRLQLSKQKLVNAVAIALQAERLLASAPITGRLRANPDLVIRILEDGSSADEDWLKDFWGGLLATSCIVDAKDESSLIFIESFSRLTTILSSMRSNLRETTLQIEEPGA